MSRTANKKGGSSARHQTAAILLLALLCVALIVLLTHFGLTGAQRYAANETPAPSAEPTAELTPAATDVPAETPPAATEAPDYTEPPAETYVRTAVLIDGNEFAVLASRQAAEELINTVVAHYERLMPGAVTSLSSKVEFVEAAEDAETVNFDSAFALLTGEDSPIVIKSSIARNEFEVIQHSSSVTESALYYTGTRFVSSYGRDGKKMRVHEYIYVNGEPHSDDIREELILAEPVDEKVIIGTRPIPEGDVSDSGFDMENCPSAPFAFIAPASGKVERFFGFYEGVLHRGVDIACPGGECKAPAAGTVAAVIERGALGMTVDIDHGSGFVTRCAMLSSASVSVGDRVAAGTVIGTSGESGLHFEVIANGLPRNPFAYVRFETARV